MSVSRKKITQYLNDLLNIDTIKDISLNGLQCEGKKEISRIALSVDACMKTYQKAVKHKCEMLLCHHGFIWGGLKQLQGPLYKQIKYLMDHELNVYAAHLPLDLHPEYGNNIQLAKMISLNNIQPFGVYDGNPIGYYGELKKPLSAENLAKVFQKKIGGAPLVLPFGKKEIVTVGIVSGRASNILSEAIFKEIDCLVTGEGSHENHHAALEGEVNVVFLGHYYSEQFGVKALGKHLEETFEVETVYLDEPTLF